MRTRLSLYPAALLCCCALSLRAAESGKPDLTRTCISLNKIQEPALDAEAMSAALTRLEGQVRERTRNAKNPAATVKALNEVLLTGRLVTYISNKYWRDSTLSSSLLRRRGNCLSTTTLYVVIGTRLGIPIRAVVVPKHALARYDDGKTRINIETTGGGVSLPDEHYRTRSPWYEVDGRVLGYGRSLSDGQFLALLHRSAAVHLHRSNRPAEALELAQKATELWPENHGFEFDRLSILYDGLGKQREALAGLSALGAGTTSIEVGLRVQVTFARHLQGLSDHDKALKVLRRAFAPAPKYMEAQVLSMMASSYRTLRRFDEALVAQELSTIIEGDAEDFTGLAIFYKNAKRLEDAIRCLRVSLRMNPENWNTRLILAGYLIRAGHEDEGWDMFRTVQKPRVDEAFYQTNMAWFYGSVGRKKEFLEHLEKALSLSYTPGILNYIKTEVDFDRYRADPDFSKLVERHRKRLLGGRPETSE